MLILSPSKGQDFETKQPHIQHTVPMFLDQSLELIQLLRSYSVAELRALMQISEKIAELNVERYKAFHLPFSEDNAKSAYFAFTGDVYRGIEADKYSTDDLNFAQQHVRILSGLYGCLRPLDLIQPYRLEMKTKLANPKGDTLYRFWGNQVAEAINQAALASDSPYLFNLASNEYSKVIDKKSLTVPFIDIIFQEEKDGKLRSIAVFGKRARGSMADYMVKNRVTTPEEVKKFNKDGYTYTENLSSENRFVFIRPQP